MTSSTSLNEAIWARCDSDHYLVMSLDSELYDRDPLNVKFGWEMLPDMTDAAVANWGMQSSDNSHLSTVSLWEVNAEIWGHVSL